MASLVYERENGLVDTTRHQWIKKTELHVEFVSVFYSPTRKPSLKEVPVQDEHDENLDRMLNDFQQQRAAKALQRQWRGYQGRKKQQIEEQERQRQDRENQAASTLQKNWRTHRERVRVLVSAILCG